MNRPSEFESLLEQEYQYQPQQVVTSVPTPIPTPPVEIRREIVKEQPPTDAEIARRALVASNAVVSTAAQGFATGFFKFIGGLALIWFLYETRYKIEWVGIFLAVWFAIIKIQAWRREKLAEKLARRHRLENV
jgi:hypothetical protein